jgi:ribosomal protein S8E
MPFKYAEVGSQTLSIAKRGRSESSRGKHGRQRRQQRKKRKKTISDNTLKCTTMLLFTYTVNSHPAFMCKIHIAIEWCVAEVRCSSIVVGVVVGEGVGGYSLSS